MDSDRALGQRLDDRDAYLTLVEGLKIAESSARRLALVRADKHWMIIASNIESVRTIVSALMQSRTRPFSHPWVT